MDVRSITGGWLRDSWDDIYVEGWWMIGGLLADGRGIVGGWFLDG
jgi:hypothetical protein